MRRRTRADRRWRRDRQAMFDTIVDGTRRTLDFARRTGARRFLLTSSGAVYGRQPAELTHVPEEYAGAPDPTDAGHVYGEGKRAAEMLCALHADRGVAADDRAMLRVRRALPAARCALRGRQFHPGRAPGRPDSRRGRRHAVPFVFVCGGPRDLAVDDPAAWPGRCVPTTSVPRGRSRSPISRITSPERSPPAPRLRSPAPLARANPRTGTFQARNGFGRNLASGSRSISKMRCCARVIGTAAS